MSFSTYLEDYVLDLIFGNTSYWQPWISVGLSTANPGEEGAGLAEPVGNGYARVLTESVDWTYSFFGLIENVYPLIFEPATGNWGLITHFALFDEDYYGTMLAYGEVIPNITIDVGLTASFDASTLVVSID